ncbi:MAG: SDR family oxidoreductase [Burkholderiaceae bacterium]
MTHHVLILGTNGMLGSMLTMRLGQDRNFSLFGASRSEVASSIRSNLAAVLTGLDAMRFDAAAERLLTQFMQQHQIKVVLNCMGVIKQQQGGQDPVTTVAVNSLFPHQIAQVCERLGARMVHISTDCVFSGKIGGYTEDQLPDATDFYGRSKALGEMSRPHLTLRTSIIGPELPDSAGLGLLSWFWRQGQPTIKGFTKAVFSGVTTLTLSDLIARIIHNEPDLGGLYHVASTPIDKHALLSTVNDVFGMGIDIVKDESLVIDRSLNAARLKNAIGYSASTWDVQIKEMFDFMSARHISG